MSTRFLVAGDHLIVPSIFADAICAEVKSVLAVLRRIPEAHGALARGEWRGDY